MIMFEMIHRETIWPNEGTSAVIKRVVEGRKPMSVDMVGGRPQFTVKCRKDVRELIMDCWVGDKDKRPSFEHIVPRLQTMTDLL